MIAQALQRLLGTRVPAVAIAFRDTPPAGVPRVASAGPSGCSYWKAAAEGETFYTEGPDHFGCPVGAHTHSVPLPADQAKELEGLVGTMVGLEYLTMDDVATLPRLAKPWTVAVYSPLADAPCDPDVVMVRADVRGLMLLSEAASAAKVAGEGPTMGRPTCAVLPLAIGSNRGHASFGCIGNRVYTGTGQDEGWFAIPGPRLEALVAKLETIVKANEALEGFHRGRASTS
jgi:uncharacterized protein (DUF169 family)